MNPPRYLDGVLYAEGLALPTLAERYGTPCYVYSRTALEQAYRDYAGAFAGHPHLVCYAVKANSNLAVINLFARLGAGFDIVSGGELRRVLAAGGNPGKVVCSGVGKTVEEMKLGLDHGILCFNVESESELIRLNEVALQCARRAPVSLRVNPAVDPKTHPYIATGMRSSKFGVPYEEAQRIYRKAAKLPGIQVHGIDFHIGSALMDTGPVIEAAEKVLALVDRLNADGISIEHIDVGGGLGIPYQGEPPVDITSYAQRLVRLFAGRRERLLLEPGRYLVARAGLLLTRTLYLKRGEEKNFAVVDAAMNDLLRPALYAAFHEIVPVVPRVGESQIFEVVGPVCESGDFLGHDRELNILEGDLLAVLDAGAYGMAMSSNYNTRPRACEILVDRGEAHEIRPREDTAMLFANEKLLPE